MFSQEWPLMMFTLVSQLAIGSFLLLMLIRTMVKDPKLGREVTQGGILWVGPVMVLALILSFFHLGTPSGAYRSLLNLGSSWLSREILTAGGFLILWCIYYILYRKKEGGNGLGLLTSLVGLAGIFSMASIYYNTIRPAWSNLNTFIAFFGATLALGTVGAGLSLIATNKKETLANVLPVIRKLAPLGLLGLVIPLIYFPVFMSGLAKGGMAAASSVSILAGSYISLLVVRWLLSAAGIALYFVAFYGKNKSVFPAQWIYLSFVLVLVGEFLGRYAFYGSAVSLVVGKF